MVGCRPDVIPRRAASEAYPQPFFRFPPSRVTHVLDDDREWGTIRPALANLEEFLALDLRVGTIVSAEILRGARTPAFALRVDFGALGVRSCSAEIADLYEPGELVGLQVVGVVNIPPKRVAGMESEAAVLVADNGKGERMLLIPERPVPDGAKVS